MILEYNPGLVICSLANGGVGVGVTVAVAVLVGVRVGYGHFGRTVSVGSIVTVGVYVCVGGMRVAVGGGGVMLGLTTGVSVCPTITKTSVSSGSTAAV